MQTILLAFFVLLGFANAVEWIPAGTTRYWDCSKPHCAWAPNWKNKQDQSNPFFSHNYAFQRCANCPMGAKYFGTAAASSLILKGYGACGKCFALRKRGGTQASLIVQVNNWCPEGNPVCNGKHHFDIAAPGFDFNAASISNTCQKNDKSLLYYGGKQGCMDTPVQSCNCARVSSDPRLINGCKLFVELGWNNQNVDYTLVPCPSIAPAKASTDDTFEYTIEETNQVDETNFAVEESNEGEEFVDEQFVQNFDAAVEESNFGVEEFNQVDETNFAVEESNEDEEFVDEQFMDMANSDVTDPVNLDTPAQTQESLPGWAVGILVVASVACVVIIVLAVFLVSKKY